MKLIQKSTWKRMSRKNRLLALSFGCAWTVAAVSAIKAGAVTPLLFSLLCPNILEGTCSANFSGGALTSTLVMPVARDPADASRLTAGTVGGPAVDLKDQPSVIEGVFEGGPTGEHSDSEIELNRANLAGGGSFDIPSGGKPSPLFGAEPFTQALLLFEEFGLEAFTASASPSTLPLPQASTDPNNRAQSSIVTKSSPPGTGLDALLKAPGLYPFPTRVANTSLANPWWPLICQYLGRADCASHQGPIEGRPPGEGWSHQRWSEFYPSKQFKTIQAGARVNGGARDKRQLHRYAVGEFAPGGLYHNTAGGLAGFNGTTAGIDIRFHPKMPVQSHRSVWTFDGTLPPKLLMVRYGEPVLMRHYNALPIDVSANKGFGMHTISTHEHNGHNPAESDGYAGAFYYPGQYFDYRWPIALAGHDTVNTSASDPRAATPCAKGEVMRVMRKTGVESVTCDTTGDPTGLAGKIKVRGDYREAMSTHWFHDHMLDFTSQNVYKGNAAMMNYYSAIDRGNETLNDGVNLRLPSGSGLPWGNRDYDVNLVLGDKAWDAEGQLWMDVFNRNGFLGDQMTVNFAYKPKFDVRARRYRFRILNGSVARYMKIALVREIAGTTGALKGPAGSRVSYETVPFHMIGNDGNIMEHAVAFDGLGKPIGKFTAPEKGILPVQSIAERYDIIIDFAKNNIRPGDKLYFVNILEHKDGRKPERVIPLADVLSGAYKASVDGDRYVNADPAVGTFMRFDVKSCMKAGKAVACVDPSLNPALYVEGKSKMMIRPTITASDLSSAKHRTFVFGRSSGTDSAPWTVKVDGGSSYTADTRRISAAPNLAALTDQGMGKVEIWHMENGGGGWSHPVHVHFEEGQILSRDGAAPPAWEKWARKDMYRVGNEVGSSSNVDVAIRFREFSGSYVEHCHNTTHEDHAMLIRWDIEKPGQTLLMPSPIPHWDGVHYVDSVAVESFRTGDTSRAK